jgi:hypothetical protein
MTCDSALDRLLEADVTELRGEGDGALARHLAECERCAAVAGALVGELDRLDEGLGLWAEAGDARAAADTILAHETGDRAGPRGQRPWLRHAWAPLAAAAAVAGVLLLRPPGPEWGMAPPGPGVEPTIAVRPPPGRSAAIMKTGNPNITIVWLYQEGET